MTISLDGGMLYQWDQNRTVSAEGYSTVNVANEGDETAYVVTVSNDKAAIPVPLLETGKGVNVWAISDGNSIEMKAFTVTQRPKPNDYVYSDDEKHTFTELEEWMREEFAKLQAEAEAATSTANSASATANAAASNANAAANAANQAIAQLPLPDGNVLRDTVSGEVLSVDDAYGATPVGLRVFGKTRQNLWQNPSGTLFGITVTENIDGSMSFSGISTVPEGSLQRMQTGLSYNVKPNTTYTVSVDNVSDSVRFFSVREYFGEAGLLDHMFGGTSYGGSSVTFTTRSDVNAVDFCVGVPGSGIEASGTYKVMLNEGSEAEPWCPPGLNSVSELELNVAGKNLADITEETSSSDKIVNLRGIPVKAGESITASFVWTSVSSDPGVAIYTSEDSVQASRSQEVSGQIGSNSSMSATSSAATQTLTHKADVDGYAYLRFVLPNETISSIQLELGSTATDYEPPSITTIPIDLDGNELRGLPDGTRDVLDVGSGEIEEKVKGKTISSISDTVQILSTGVVKLATGGVAGTTNITMCDKVKTVNEADYKPRVFVDSFGEVFLQEYWSSIEEATAGLNSYYPLNINYKSGSIQQIDVDTVALPTLPSPNCNVWATSDVPCEVELEYIRDVNVVHAKQDARIAELEEAITAISANM